MWNVGGRLGSSPTFVSKVLPRRRGLGTKDRTGGHSIHETRDAAPPHRPPVHPGTRPDVASTGGRAHHGGVGSRGLWRRAVVASCLLVPAAGAAGCSYDYQEPGHAAATTASASPAPSLPTSHPADPLVLEREVRNYGELDGILKAVPGRVLLFLEGPLDGPARGFGSTEQVESAGEYTVTAACVGAASATVFIRQENPTVTLWPVELTVDCPGSVSRVITLQQGYVSAHLSLPAPADSPWTGAVAGVRVTY